MMKAIGIGVPAGEPKTCSGTLFTFRCKSDGYKWGGLHPTRDAAEAYKRSFFDKRVAEFKAMNEKIDLYDVEIIEVPSEEPDAIQTPWGEFQWNGKFDEKGVKLYDCKIQHGYLKEA